MINYYRRCIPIAAELQRRLQVLIKTNKKNDKTPLIWMEDAELAYDEFKKALSQATLLSHPNEALKIALYTDASDTATGGVLQQLQNGQPEPLAFFSRNLSATEA